MQSQVPRFVWLEATALRQSAVTGVGHRLRTATVAAVAARQRVAERMVALD